MTQLGAIDTYRGRKIDPVHFFSVNMTEFFREFGLNPTSWKYGIREMSQSHEVQIMCRPDVVSVMFNRQLIQSLHELKVDDGLYIYSLWFYLIEYFRQWVVIRKPISASELVPAKFLYDNPSAKSLVDSIVSRHEMNIISTWTMFRLFDANAVALHISSLIELDPVLIESLKIRDIADFVINARANNWKGLIS